MQALSEASATLAQKMYSEDAAQAQPGAEGAAEAAADNPADADAVDAEFEEVDEDERRSG